MEENTTEQKSSARWKVVGINLGCLFAYTLICRFIDGGIMIDAFLIAIHFVAGIIASVIIRRWEWVLSAFLILAIGFFTCVSFLDMPNMY